MSTGLGGYETLTPDRTPEQIARQNLQRVQAKEALRERIRRRRAELENTALRQQRGSYGERRAGMAPRPPEDTRTYGERRMGVPRPTFDDPTVVEIDGVQRPLSEAIAEIPQELAAQDRIEASPLRERALTRARADELSMNGMSQAEAMKQAMEEREGRQRAFQRGQRSLESGAGNVDKETESFANQMATGLGGPVARMLGFSQAADELEAYNAGVQSAMTRHRQENYAYPGLAGAVAGAAASTAQMAPGIAASMIAGPQVGMGVMAGQFGLQRFSSASYEAAESGLAGTSRLGYAGVQGGIEASIMPLFNRIPGMGGIEKRVLAGKVVGGLRQKAAQLGKDTLAEIAEEVTTEVSQGLAQEIGLNEDVDFESVIKDTVLQTAIMMGMGEATRAGGRLITQDPAARKALEDFAENPSRTNLKKIPGEVMGDFDLQDTSPVAERKAAAAKIADALKAERESQKLQAKPKETEAEAAQSQQQAADWQTLGQEEQVKADDAFIERSIGDPDFAWNYAEQFPDQAKAIAESGRYTNQQLQSIDPDLPSVDTPAARRALRDNLRQVLENEDLRDAARAGEQENMEAGKWTMLPEGVTPPDSGQVETRELFGRTFARIAEPEAVETETIPPETETVTPEIAEETPETENPPDSPAAVEDVSQPAEPETEAPDADLQSELQVELQAELDGETQPDTQTKPETAPETPEAVEDGPAVAGTPQTQPEAATEPPTDPVPQAPTTPPTSVDGPDAGTQYVSGLTRSPREMDATIESGGAVGVSALDSISLPVRKRLTDYANQGGQVFIDSGAYTAFKKGREIDWDKVQFQYNEMITSVEPENRENVTVVAPDIVGDHEATIELHDELRRRGVDFQKILDSGAQVIIPVQQGGHNDIMANFADLTDSFTAESMEGVTIGVAFNAASWSPSQVMDLLRFQNKQGTLNPVHLLGVSDRNDKLRGLFDRAAAEGIDVSHVSSDAVSAKVSARRRGTPKPPPAEAPNDMDATLREMLREGLKGIKPATAKRKATTKKRPVVSARRMKLFNDAADTAAELDRLESQIDADDFGDRPRDERRSIRKQQEDAQDKLNELESKIADQIEKMTPTQFQAAWDELGPERQTVLEGFDEPGRPDPEPKPKKSPAKARTAAKKKKLSDALAELDKLVDELGSQANSPTLDPRWLRAVTNVAVAAVEVGVSKFAEYLEVFRERYNSETVRQMAPAIERAWDMLRDDFDFDVDAAGDVETMIREGMPKFDGEDIVARSLKGDLTDADLAILRQAVAFREQQMAARVTEWAERTGVPIEKHYAHPSWISEMARQVPSTLLTDMAAEWRERLRKGHKNVTAELMTRPVQQVIDRVAYDPTTAVELTDPTMKGTGTAVDSQGRKETNVQTTDDGYRVSLVYTKGVVDPITREDGTVDVTQRRGEVPNYWLAQNDENRSSAVGQSMDEALQKARDQQAGAEVRRQENESKVYTEGELQGMRPKRRVRDIAAARGIENAENKRYATLIREILESQNERFGPETNSDDGVSADTSGVVGRQDGEPQTTGDDGVLEDGTTADAQTSPTTGTSGATVESSGRRTDDRDESTDVGAVDQSVGRGEGDNVDADDGGRRDDRPAGPTVERANYELTEPERIMGGGQRTKFARNQQAIELVQRLVAQNAEPTPDQLDIIAGYTGWGAFGQELFNGSWENPQPKEDWVDQDEWLREHLGEDEWKSAQNSINNAHFTDPITAGRIWDALRRMGFKGGRVLEPAVGVGNFFSTMPRDLMQNSQLTGIELDQLTARMAQLLHPNANIQQMGYQRSETPDDFYDLIISNVPFADVKISDRRYDKFNPLIHNYYFMKAIDQVRPGGIVAFITSTGTMDGVRAERMRAELDKKADLIKAIRLPGETFSQYAGTKVVTDVIFLRKKVPNQEFEGKSWKSVSEWSPEGSDESIKVNDYWAENPGDILGGARIGRGVRRSATMVVDRTDDFAQQLDTAIKSLPQDIVTDRKTVAAFDNAVANDTKARQFSVVEKDDQFYVVRGTELFRLEDVVKRSPWVKSPKKTEKRKKALREAIAMRDALTEVLDLQRRGEDTAEARQRLNTAYESFKVLDEKDKLRDSQLLKMMVRLGDPMARAVQQLEVVNPDQTTERRPIFTQSTTRSRPNMENLSIGDAYAVHRNNSNSLAMIDTAEIAKAANTSEKEVVAELVASNAIYRTPHGTWQAADVYLSGNVRRKLREAEAAQREGVPDLARSVEALRSVVPEDVPYTSIEVNLGASWVPETDYQNFVATLLNIEPDDVQIQRLPNNWRVTFRDRQVVDRDEANTTWGHPAIKFNKLLENAMGNGSIRIYGRDAEGNRKFDEQATSEAMAKAEEIREEFKTWLWQDPERATRNATAYNETFNSYATPQYDGSHLSFEGLMLEMGSDPFSFRKHQSDAVWRGLLTGRGLYAHEVGTGKTFTMGALAIESRRLGLANKPVLFAHNANSSAVAADIQMAYPGAKVLYVNNLAADTRDDTLSQIALDTWDLVVIPHSLVGRMAMRPETLQQMLGPEIKALEMAAREAIEEDGGGDGIDWESDDIDVKKIRNPTAKELVKERQRLVERIAKAEQMTKDKATVWFEDTGIDMMMVDEAHIFKKQPISTKQQLKGLNKTGSDRGIMMQTLARFVSGNNNGRGVHLFTGTPITNTLNEVFNLQRLIMPDVMERDGVQDWDTWFNQFAEATEDVELTSGGTWDSVNRLSKFINVPELRQMFDQYLDIVYAEDMPEFVDRDTVEGFSETPVGRPFRQIHIETAPMTPEQAAHNKELQERYKRFQALSGRAKRDARRTNLNPIVIEGEGVKNALDPRLIDESWTADENTKAARITANVMTYYREDDRSTQMIFMQNGLKDFVERSEMDEDGNTRKYKVPQFNLAKDIKRRLVEQGVKESEIVIFSDMTPAKRAMAAQQMRNSEVRVAIGSSETMGTGVNAQTWLRAMHHADAPWMPGDLEQRNGRGWRQGNHWNTVHEHRYLTEASHDGRRWQILLSKDRIIKQFLKGDATARVVEGDAVDMSETGGDGMFAETFADAVGNPLVLKKIALEKQVDKLQRAKDRHAQNQVMAVSESQRAAKRIESLNSNIARNEADAAVYLDESAKPFDAVLLNPETQKMQRFSERDKADERLYNLKKFYEGKVANKTLGEFRGFDLSIEGFSLKLNHPERPRRNDEITMNPSFRSADAQLRNLSRRITDDRAEIRRKEQFIEQAESLKGKPFPREDELARKKAQFEQIAKELDESPDAPPSWLRDGAPMGTSIFVDGQEHEVQGHRNKGGALSVLIEDGEGYRAVPADKVTDQSGLPIFPDAPVTPETPEASDDTPSSKGPSGNAMAIESQGDAYVPVRPEEPEATEDDAEEAAAPVATLPKTKAGKIWSDVIGMLSPAHVSDISRSAGHIMRKEMARATQWDDAATANLSRMERMFYMMEPEEAYAFIDRMEAGEDQPTPELQGAADAIRKELDRGRERLQQLGKLKDFYENYFPHLWKDVDNATRVLRNVSAGKAWRSSGFLQQRVHITHKEGRDAGLVPITDNPVEMALRRLQQVNKYVARTNIMARLKQSGMMRFVPESFDGKDYAPFGFEYYDDPAFRVETDPSMTVEEAYDKLLVDQLAAVATRLGTDLDRVASINGRPNVWGLSEGDKVTTRFAGPVSILAHEIGHQIGDKFGLFEYITKGEHTKGVRFRSGRRKGQENKSDARRKRAEIQKELRALADLRAEGLSEEQAAASKAYRRKRAEKEAVILEAWLAAPEKMAEVAPNVTAAWKDFLEANDVVSPLLNLDRSVVLETREQRIEQPGRLLLGKWAMPRDVARMVKNMLSPGLRGNPNEAVRGLWRMTRLAGNAMNQASLSLSLFHALNVTIDASASALGQSIQAMERAGRKALQGRNPLPDVMQVIGKTVTAPIAGVTPYVPGAEVSGGQLVKAMRSDIENLSPEMQDFVETAITAGARSSMDPIYHNQMTRRIVQSIRDVRFGEPVKKLQGAAKLPVQMVLGTLEMTAKPIMEYMVPRLKLAVFYRLAEDVYQRAAEEDLTDTQIREQLTQSWDNVENRMGQLAYDNLFWSQYLTDAAMLSLRSVGWNLGSLREFGGAITDVLTIPQRLERGDQVVSRRMGYAIGSATIYATLGALIMKAFGVEPEELRDYFFPPTGRTNPDGSPERLSLPTYAKDWVAWSTQPGTVLKHKLHPMWGTLADMVTNEDFYGTEIRHEDDPWYVQAKDTLMHAFESFVPFSLKNKQRFDEAGEHPLVATLMAYSGVASAPAYVSRSPAQKLAYLYMAENIPAGSRTKDDAAKSRQRRTLIERFRKGEPVSDTALEIYTARQLKIMEREAKRTPFEAVVSRLRDDQAMKVYEIAKDDEREQVRELLIRRFVNKATDTAEGFAEEMNRQQALASLNQLEATPAEGAEQLEYMWGHRNWTRQDNRSDLSKMARLRGVDFVDRSSTDVYEDLWNTGWRPQRTTALRKRLRRLETELAE